MGPAFLFCYFKLKVIHSRSILHSRGVHVSSWQPIPSSLFSSAQPEGPLLTRVLDRTILPHLKILKQPTLPSQKQNKKKTNKQTSPPKKKAHNKNLNKETKTKMLNHSNKKNLTNPQSTPQVLFLLSSPLPHCPMCF